MTAGFGIHTWVVLEFPIHTHDLTAPGAVFYFEYSAGWSRARLDKIYEATAVGGAGVPAPSNNNMAIMTSETTRTTAGAPATSSLRAPCGCKTWNHPHHGCN